MSANEIKRTFEPGARFDLVNHYITRPDHPCYGTRSVVVERVTSGGLWLTTDGGEAQRIEAQLIKWPSAKQIERNEHGAVRFYGGGVNQEPSDLFLTLIPR